MSESVQLDDLALGLSRRGAPITPESGYFIALQCLEAMRDQLRVLSPYGVEVDEAGAVQLNEMLSPAVVEVEVLDSVITTLEAVLSPLPGPALYLGARVRSGEVTTRAQMVAELSAMLVPFNRGAAQRMLGRFVREHLRPHGHAPAPEARDDLGQRALLVGTTDELPTADRTEPDGALDWEPPRRRGPSTAFSVMTLLFSMGLLAGAVWFVLARISHRA